MQQYNFLVPPPQVGWDKKSRPLPVSLLQDTQPFSFQGSFLDHRVTPVVNSRAPVSIRAASSFHQLCKPKANCTGPNSFSGVILVDHHLVTAMYMNVSPALALQMISFLPFKFISALLSSNCFLVSFFKVIGWQILQSRKQIWKDSFSTNVPGLGIIMEGRTASIYETVKLIVKDIRKCYRNDCRYCCCY